MTSREELTSLSKMLKNNEPREQLEFLKREEVRTMAKDIAQLREEEAKKERDRITKIKPEEPKKEAPAPARTPHPQPIPPSLMPHAEEQKPTLPRAKTRPEKILIRVIVIGVLLFILLNGLAFGYWYLTRKQVVEVTPSMQLIEPEGSSEPERPAPPIVEEPIVPSPTPSPALFFETAQEKTIDLGPTDSLIALLSGALKEEYPQGFTRIRVPLTAREFLNKAALAMPESLLSLLKEDFMLFAYSSPGRKRLGFVGELTQTEGAQDILKNWETTVEQDIKPLWEIVGQKGSAYTPFFRQTTYLNNLVRFQTFSVIDFGIVYSVVGTKLILTTSFESLTRAVDLLAQSGR